MIKKFDGEWNYEGCTIRFRDAPLTERFTRYFIYREGQPIETIDLQGGDTDLNRSEIIDLIDSHFRRMKLSEVNI